MIRTVGLLKFKTGMSIEVALIYRRLAFLKASQMRFVSRRSIVYPDTYIVEYPAIGDYMPFSVVLRPIEDFERNQLSQQRMERIKCLLPRK